MTYTYHSPKKVLAGALAALMLLSCASLPASAAEISSVKENTTKEEVIYINLNANGSVKEIYAVNSFLPEADGTITDYGTYTNIRNMTTTDEISCSDDVVTITTAKDKLFYEGKMTDTEIPWDMEFCYYMDGTEYSAEEIAGKSGSLTITGKIQENTACRGTFFEGFALQASVTLSSKQCKNIKAPDATIANVGSDKQLTYTILPGKGTEFIITADVTNFEMDPISINGIKLALDIDVDDAEIQDRIRELMDATVELNDGADELKEGVQELYDGTKELEDKTGNLKSGAKELLEGSDDLSDALSTITAQNDTLVNGASAAFEGLCGASETILNQQLISNGLSPVALTPDTYSRVLMELLKQLNADAVYQQAYNAALAEVTAQVNAQADELYTAYISSQADSIYVQAAEQTISAQLTQQGMTAEQIESYLASPEGQALLSQTISGMTEDQKAQILAGALVSLTESEKAQIREACIQQMMASDEVISQITAAVTSVSEAAGQISDLKGQLDSFSLLCQGIKDYTSAVSEVKSGAKDLKNGLAELYEGTDKLADGAEELKDGVKELFDGVIELKDGTQEFEDETSGMDSDVDEEIDSMISSASGKDVAIMSFTSEKNTNIESVQFVITTESIEIPEAEEVPDEETTALSFWEKLLQLFGL